MAKKTIEVHIKFNEEAMRLARLGVDFAVWCADNSPHETDHVFGDEGVCIFCLSLPNEGHAPDCLWDRAMEINICYALGEVGERDV